MMTITSSMMMMPCLVDPVGAEVATQSNSGLQHSSILGAWVCRAGCGAGGRVKSRFASSTLFLSLLDPVCFCCSCSGMNHAAPQGSILGADFPVGNINIEACEGLLNDVLEAFLLPTNWSFAIAELTIYELFWQAVIRHPYHVACPSHLSFLQYNLNTGDACSCEDFCVRHHVLSLDAQNNPQTFCI